MAKIDLLEIRKNRELWKNINVNALSGEIKIKYQARKKAVDLYIDGLEPKIIAKQTGISSSEIIRLVRKCIKINTNQEQIGYAALIPNKHNVKSRGKLGELFLQYPSLELFVIGNYFGDKKYTLEHNMNIRTLHTKFVAECRRLGIQDYEYPFTLKDNGYYILYTYIKQKRCEMQAQTIKREKKDVQQKFASTGYGETLQLKPLQPYEVTQIDGHKIDMLYTVATEDEQGEIKYDVATRIWLIAVIDVATRSIIGYSVSPYEIYNQYDVLQAIRNAIVPHEKIEFTHAGLKYPETGGFPSLALPETQWATFDMLMLDNAKSHLAKNTLDKLINSIKCTVNFGPVATPETRGIIERFFKTLETGGFHRLPGTTGSNIQDTKRKNPEKECVKYNITYDTICQLIEYLIAEYNTSAHSALENQTPLQCMERRIRQAGMRPYIIPASERPDIEKLTYFTIERILRGGYSSGSQPHISYLSTRYHAYDKKIPMDMIGQKVYLEVNPADVSHIDLYDKDGIFIANLIAIGEWGRHSHSLKTHQAAIKRENRNKEKTKSFSPDLTRYEEELRENAKKSRRDRTNAAIAKREKNNKHPSPESSSKYKTIKDTIKEKKYSKEEMALIDSMSLEEAYRRGLI